MRYRKYHKTWHQAQKFLVAWLKLHPNCNFHIFRMPKGSRRPGMYAVCTYLDYVNTY